MVKQYGTLYLDTRRALLSTETPESAGTIARYLICHYSGKSPEYVLSHSEIYAGEDVCRGVEEGLQRLLNEEPLPYVLGEWEFYGLPLYVGPQVLIPRDDTCAVAELAINKGLFLEKDPRILDLCCGSGCIGLAVASRVKDAKVTLADLSQDALNMAKKNVQRNKMSGRVRCIGADALKEPPAFLGKFDMIVSNPPYITGAEMEALPRSVKDYEPHMALYGGDDGLIFYRAIAKNFQKALKPGGYLCFEFGMGQGDDVCRILEENGFTVLERTKDYNERERAVIAQYRGEEDYHGNEENSL